MLRKIKCSFNDLKLRVRVIIPRILLALYVLLSCSNTAYASDLSNNEVIKKIPGGTGTVLLIGDVTTVLQLIAPGAAVLFFIWRCGQQGITDDQGDENRYKKLRNKTLIITIAIELAPFIINWFLGYYKIKGSV